MLMIALNAAPIWIWIILTISALSLIIDTILYIITIFYLNKKYPAQFNNAVQSAPFSSISIRTQKRYLFWSLIAGKLDLDDYIKNKTFYIRILTILAIVLGLGAITYLALKSPSFY